jgi:surface antigen
MISATSKVKQKMKKKILQSLKKPRVATGVVTVLAVISFLVMPVVHAVDRFTGQINELSQENSQLNAQSQSLRVEAASLQDAINVLQVQISGLEAQINDSNQQIAETEAKIANAEAELTKQRTLLSENIRAMYLEGQMTTLEMLATSKDLSEYVDKQQYRDTIKNKIKETLDKVTALKLQLKAEKDALEAQKQDQEARQGELAAQRGEQSRLLNLTTSQKAAVDAEIRSNNAQITELRRQQAIENAKIFGTAGTGAACGGGYPGSAPGPWGYWGCNYSLDNTIDNWGMYNRECVSYTAFKVAASGRHMPYWGGRGNANKWDDNARAAGIPVDTHPRPGDVAIINAGYYGHAMYVEDVLDDGRILISHYNYDWAGNYQVRTISTAGMVFIHFP